MLGYFFTENQKTLSRLFPLFDISRRKVSIIKTNLLCLYSIYLPFWTNFDFKSVNPYQLKQLLSSYVGVTSWRILEDYWVTFTVEETMDHDKQKIVDDCSANFVFCLNCPKGNSCVVFILSLSQGQPSYWQRGRRQSISIIGFTECHSFQKSGMISLRNNTYFISKDNSSSQQPTIIFQKKILFVSQKGQL